jgi:hypothetical protein
MCAYYTSTSAQDRIDLINLQERYWVAIPLVMSLRSESNACTACARAKRKCGRQIPACARCADKRKSCIYPPSKKQTVSSYRHLLSDVPVLRGEDTSFAESPVSTSHVNASLYTIDNLMWDVGLPSLGSNIDAPESQIRIPSAMKTDWFLAPETWTISRRSTNSDDVPIGTAAMKKYVTVLQSWFKSWVTTGSNPFVHSCLYGVNFPTCVQVAYATLASYVYRTPANTEIVLRIVEDRSNDLLLENGAVLDQTTAGKWVDVAGRHDDLWGQLTRLHARLVYQMIMSLKDIWRYRIAGLENSSPLPEPHCRANKTASLISPTAYPSCLLTYSNSGTRGYCQKVSVAPGSWPSVYRLSSRSSSSAGEPVLVASCTPIEVVFGMLRALGSGKDSVWRRMWPSYSASSVRGFFTMRNQLMLMSLAWRCWR